MEKDGITRFIEKLHSFNKKITKLMVNSWKDGCIKINGVTHQVNVE